MDKASRMERARKLGFTIPAYHGTGTRFNAFDLEKGKGHNHGGGYAPHFTDRKEEAAGYAVEKNPTKNRVLPILLRLKNPFVVSFDDRISPQLFKKLTGEDWERFKQDWAAPSIHSPPASYNALEAIRRKYAGNWDNPKQMWSNVYADLIRLGYDGLLFPKTPADHVPGYYTKYVVFDPKNIRLTTARFDPAQSEATDLRA